MKIFINTKSCSVLNFTKFKFSSKLYNSENLKFQKTFKFTSDQSKQKEIKNRDKYFDNKIKIKQLEQDIKKYDILMYTSESTNAKQTIMMKKTEKLDVDSDINDEEQLKPVNSAFKNNRDELIKLMKNLKIENERIESSSLKSVTKASGSSKKDDEYDIMRISYIRDMFSHSYSFANKFLNIETYETVNKQDLDKPWAVRKEEEEINKKQSDLEKEISIVLDDMINKEMSKFDIESTPIPHRLADKPILRSIPADMNQPRILLVENDLNCNYGLDLEYERLLRLTRNDDFGQKIKEDQNKDEDKEEVIQDEEKDFFNDGNQPNTLMSDPSISILAK